MTHRGFSRRTALVGLSALGLGCVGQGLASADTGLAGMRVPMTQDEVVARALFYSSTGAARLVVTGFIPICGNSGEVFAYCVLFGAAGYVIINNNRDNPVALEFSENDSTGSVAAMRLQDSIRLASSSSENGFLASLRRPNIEVADYHQRYMEKFGDRIGQRSGSILPPTDLPRGIFTSNHIPATLGSMWGTTSEFAGIGGAANHCGSTAAFNVIAYYRNRLSRPALMLSARSATFAALHARIGDGPVLFNALVGGLKSYVQSRGSSFGSAVTGGWVGIKREIDAGRMAIMLLTFSLFNWHYVNAIGYRRYQSGGDYIQVVNGWENTTARYVLASSFGGSYRTHIT